VSCEREKLEESVKVFGNVRRSSGSYEDERNLLEKPLKEISARNPSRHLKKSQKKPEDANEIPKTS
jgi:hypothetical protein